MKSYLLAFDCSFDSAGLALLDLEQLQLVKYEIKTDKVKSEQKTRTKLDLLQESEDFTSSKELKDKLRKSERQHREPIKTHLETESSKKEIISSLSIKPFDIKWSSIKIIPGFIEKTWDSSSGSHSDQLPLKIKEAFEEALFQERSSTHQNLKFSSLNLKKDLKGVVVGAGPGRFTGIRTALSVAKSLAYSLQTPICPINSLQLIAESYFEDSSFEAKKSENHSPKSKLKDEYSQVSQDFSKVYVSLQAFKDQVYHGEFYRSDSKSFSSTAKEKNSAFSLKESLSLLDFKDWEEKIMSSHEKKLLCLSDLKSFYQINPQALKKLQIQKPKISPWILIKLALEQGNWKEDWKKIQPNYMRYKI